MTDSIDLDEMDVGDDDEQADDANHGDWLWRGEGDPDDEPAPQWSNASSTTRNEDESTDSSEPTTDTNADPTAETDDAESATRPATPKVPGDPTGPVGVPEEKGGSGGGSPSQQDGHASSDASARTTDHGESTAPDDMTLALTYEAINRLADPQFVIADARGWADWIGIVGTVSTPAIRKFQRDEGIDLDFFGGSETGPAQRLADVTPESMFYADRMVLVGVSDDEEIAEAADWEFVPLETAAEKAGWEIEFAE